LFTPWITDSSNNLTAETAVPIKGGRLTYMLGAQGVTTLVGKP
jgi:O-glycosyl hydrolase